jgi:acyl dehydratase
MSERIRCKVSIVKKHISDFYIGQSSSMERTFTEEDVNNYLRLIREDNPVYSNDEILISAQLKGKVIPGLLSEGLLMELTSKKLPGIPGLLLQKETVFHHPVYAGDTITATAEIIDIDLKRNWITMMVECTNQFNKSVITGQLIALIISNN